MKYPQSLFFLLTFLLTGCMNQSATSIPDTQPDIQGSITNMKRAASKSEQAIAVILVEAVSGIETNYPKASIKIDEKTHIEDAEGSIMQVEQLQEHQQVEVWFDGPVMESFPVQAHAAAVRVN